jgi:hypothetical protein
LSPDELERAAEGWIADYFLARHLVRTRDWVVELDPAADLALRIAALTHDIERHVPGGPRFDPSRQASDEAGYLLEHSIRSAQIVDAWLTENGAPAELRTGVERLIMHHEIGGYPEADLLQAADSISFLEVNGHRPRVWVEEGRCDLASAQGKLDWMRDRITVDAALPAAVRFHAAATALLRGEGATVPAAAPPHPASFSVSGPAQGDKRRRPGVRRDP